MDLFGFSRRYSIVLGLCPEGRLAFLAAEPIGLPLKLRAELAIVTDGHATDRVMGTDGLGLKLPYWVVLLVTLGALHALPPVRILYGV
ncbi:XdhC_C domain-containing protein [Pseudomonas sp. IT-196MI5]